MGRSRPLGRTGLRRGRRLAVTAAAAVLAVALAACTPAQVGAAAVIGDRRVTVDEVDAAVAGIKAGNPELAASEDLDRTALFFLVLAPYLLPAAQEQGVAVSDDQAEELLSKAPDPAPSAVRVLRTFLSLQKLQQAQATEALGRVQKEVLAARPEVNPRYGSFDLQQMSIVDAPPNWVVAGSAPTETAPETP